MKMKEKSLPRQKEFEALTENLINGEFSDLNKSEIADSLERLSKIYRNRANAEIKLKSMETKVNKFYGKDFNS